MVWRAAEASGKCAIEGSKSHFRGGETLAIGLPIQFKMNMLPVKWEAMKRIAEFWVQVMRMANGRLLKMVMIEALELGSKVKWVKDLWQSLEVFGWKELDVEALSGLTIREVKLALKAIARRKVRDVWREEARGRSKLGMIGR